MSRTLYYLLDQLEHNDLQTVEDFIGFAASFLDFVEYGSPFHQNIQAEIVAQREPDYHFFQYKDDGHYCVTRPVNTKLFVSENEFGHASSEFLEDLKDIKAIAGNTEKRDNINRVAYTCQQAVGCVLDSLNNANKAKKRNGDHFERLIRSIVSTVGIDNERKVQHIALNSKEKITFEHDIILKSKHNAIAAIGQLKTSSKDRLDKIFLDKYLYNKLLETDTPHFAIFLNDVQRTKAKQGMYSVGTTFLPGHFKAYSIAMDPLDGVYYFDLRPRMREDEYLSDKIFCFDHFLVEDVWTWIQ